MCSVQTNTKSFKPTEIQFMVSIMYFILIKTEKVANLEYFYIFKNKPYKLYCILVRTYICINI